MRESLLDCLREEIALRLDRGERLSRVEDQLIEGPLGLNEDERAARWLFAWSYRPAAGDPVGPRAGLLAR